MSPSVATGHPHAGALLHQDVKKLGNIPDGGGHRMLSRQRGTKNRQQTANQRRSPRSKHGGSLMKHDFVHTVVDDHSRVTYAEIHDDETAATAAGVLRRAVF